MIDFYWYPKCSTCRKAKAWLDENQVKYNQIDLVETPPTEEKLKALWQKSGLPLRRFFNTSGIKYRELGLKDKLEDMPEDEAFKLLASDGKLIKRPLTTDGTKVTLGFKEQEFEADWK
ncbi:arsenate reductase family protein [Listeria aquatica]|uniref:ArsC family protein n=1 Tax=Listeria aquatica FSL S10-1188 TaxID=1265818 RepID=W7BNC7_9LIST|nr:arsenate reductase family protein [Listeria aquatica]EUJ21558.1 ArsC family protein [Listeria aquatica FSL S10-1188]